MFTCGDGSFGQLGHGDFASHCSPVQVSSFVGQHAAQVACGMRHSLVLLKGIGLVIECVCLSLCCTSILLLKLAKVIVLLQIVLEIKFMDLALGSVVNWVSTIGSNLLMFLKLLVVLKVLESLKLLQMEIIVLQYLVKPPLSPS